MPHRRDATGTLPEGRQEASYRQASLNGHACRAIAWVQTTSVDVLVDEGVWRRVPGVRRWRGRAVVERGALPPEVFSNKAVRYNGKVLDGDEEHDILADVFLLYPFNGSQKGLVVEDGQTVVDFIGAETPSKSLV